MASESPADGSELDYGSGKCSVGARLCERTHGVSLFAYWPLVSVSSNCIQMDGEGKSSHIYWGVRICEFSVSKYISLLSPPCFVYSLYSVYSTRLLSGLVLFISSLLFVAVCTLVGRHRFLHVTKW